MFLLGLRYTPVSLSAVSGSNCYSVPGLGESPSQRPAKVPAADDVDAGAALHDLVVLRRGQRAAAGSQGCRGIVRGLRPPGRS